MTYQKNNIMGQLKIFGSYVNANYSTTSFAAYAHN